MMRLLLWWTLLLLVSCSPQQAPSPRERLGAIEVVVEPGSVTLLDEVLSLARNLDTEVYLSTAAVAELKEMRALGLAGKTTLEDALRSIEIAAQGRVGHTYSEERVYVVGFSR